VKSQACVLGSVLGVLASCVLLSVGCGSEETPTAPGEASPRGEEGVPEVFGTLPTFALTDQRGREFGSDRLHGQVWVADFIFTRCPDMCPRLTSEMARLQEKLAADPSLGAVRLLSFSVDPEHDRPPVLAAYAAKYGADPQRWTFVTGPTDELRQLVRDGYKLPVKENPDAAGTPFLHSNKFVLSDREGRIRGYYDAMQEADRERLLNDARVVLGEAYSAAKAPAPAPEPSTRSRTER